MFLEKITNLFDYEIFARVIKAGSLSAAARELHSSPAMISKRLTRLEERLGVRLLQRTTRRLTPTQVGQSFFERVAAPDERRCPSSCNRISMSSDHHQISFATCG